MTFVKLQHAKSCPSKIKICVGCLWNWQYNPVKCHSCDQEKIQSPVGDRWGAILIAGTDTNEDITKCFEDDIKKLENEVITNVTLMGVRDNVVTVKKSTTTYREQLKNAFSKIGISKINTIVLVYSGHHGDEGFQLDTHTLKDCELVDEFNRLKHVTKVIAFLDCCHPKKLILDKKAVLQFNAVTSKQSAISRPRGSLFVNDIVNVLTNPWEYKCFENTPLIRDYDMHKYFNKHPYNSSIETSQLSNTDGDLDHILTFRPVDPGWLKALEESLESSPLQAGDTSLVLSWCSIEPEDDVPQLQDEYEQQVVPSDCTTSIDLHLPKWPAIHSPAQTAQLRFRFVSLSTDVIERLVSQALVSGHWVECVLDQCSIGPPPDIRSLKENMETIPAIQIETFEFEPNNDTPHWLWPTKYKGDQTWNIRFKVYTHLVHCREARSYGMYTHVERTS
ncbi:hypothetical protein MAR_002644 [Mya arenaria]|uniref:Uncharacterized protein n=1 Tax=Mya arenaria TaxID=6604 RepID=A0ABY7G7P8_MYAAR|nr:hypothetical protein MAR_002644 [Mya arenaria]